VGVPTRNVTGFVGGTYNRFGRFYAVRQGDAHSWVEAYIDGAGWLSFDPTPPANAAPQVATTGLIAMLRDIAEAAAQRWSRYVVGYDLEQQIRLFRWAAKHYGPTTGLHQNWFGPRSRGRAIALVIVVLLAGWAVFFYVVQRRRRARPNPNGRLMERLATVQIVALYRSLEAAMASRGAARVPSTPPLTHAEALSELRHPIAREVLELTQQYVEVRYAGRALTEHDRREYTRRVRALRQGNEGVPVTPEV